MTAARPDEVVERARLRDDPDFRRYWVARMTSLFGSLVTAVAMPVLVYRLSGSTTLTALTTTLEALPYLLFGLFSGAVGDRFDRKRVMVLADFANVAVVGSVPVAWWLGGLTVPHVLVAGFVAQSLFTFFDGANFGALPVLVGRERVGEANSAVWGFGGILDLTVPAARGAGPRGGAPGRPAGRRRAHLPRVGPGGPLDRPGHVGGPRAFCRKGSRRRCGPTSARGCGSCGGTTGCAPTR